MGFFTASQKKMAKKCSVQDLVAGFQNSDIDLEIASHRGNSKDLKKAMKEHTNFERALLYRNTPKFKKKAKRG